MKEKEELLSCPFCGGEAEHFTTNPRPIREYFIFCKDCKVEVSGNTKLEAIKAWNTTPKPKEVGVEIIEKVIRDFPISFDDAEDMIKFDEHELSVKISQALSQSLKPLKELDKEILTSLMYGISKHSNKDGFGHQTIEEENFKELSKLIFSTFGTCEVKLPRKRYCKKGNHAQLKNSGFGCDECILCQEINKIIDLCQKALDKGRE